jgi:hypothetical protein
LMPQRCVTLVGSGYEQRPDETGQPNPMTWQREEFSSPVVRDISERLSFELCVPKVEKSSASMCWTRPSRSVSRSSCVARRRRRRVLSQLNHGAAQVPVARASTPRLRTRSVEDSSTSEYRCRMSEAANQTLDIVRNMGCNSLRAAPAFRRQGPSAG